MTSNGTSNPEQPETNPPIEALDPSQIQQRLQNIETTQAKFNKRLEKQDKQNPPAQQMALVPPAISPQLEADLQSLTNLPEILETIGQDLRKLLEHRTQTENQLHQFSEVMQSQRQTIESCTTNLNQYCQRCQSLESEQQQLKQEIQALKQQQQQSSEQTRQALSQIEAFIPKLANRLNPIQVLLNRAQVSTKAVLVTLSTAIVLTGLLGMGLAGLFLNAQFSPILERINGKVNSLEIQMNKQLKRLK